MKEAEQPTMAQSYEDLKSSWDLSKPGARRERTVFLPRTVISHMSMNKSAEMIVLQGKVGLRRSAAYPRSLSSLNKIPFSQEGTLNSMEHFVKLKVKACIS